MPGCSQVEIPASGGPILLQPPDPPAPRAKLPVFYPTTERRVRTPQQRKFKRKQQPVHAKVVSPATRAKPQPNPKKISGNSEIGTLCRGAMRDRNLPSEGSQTTVIRKTNLHCHAVKLKFRGGKSRNNTSQIKTITSEQTMRTTMSLAAALIEHFQGHRPPKKVRKRIVPGESYQMANPKRLPPN